MKFGTVSGFNNSLNLNQSTYYLSNILEPVPNNYTAPITLYTVHKTIFLVHCLLKISFNFLVVKWSELLAKLICKFCVTLLNLLLAIGLGVLRKYVSLRVRNREANLTLTLKFSTTHIMLFYRYQLETEKKKHPKMKWPEIHFLAFYVPWISSW